MLKDTPVEKNVKAHNSVNLHNPHHLWCICIKRTTESACRCILYLNKGLSRLFCHFNETSILDSGLSLWRHYAFFMLCFLYSNTGICLSTWTAPSLLFFFKRVFYLLIFKTPLMSFLCYLSPLSRNPYQSDVNTQSHTIPGILYLVLYTCATQEMKIKIKGVTSKLYMRQT